MDGRKWTKEKFDALISGFSSDGGWFKLHRALMKKLGLEAAAVLHYLLDYHVRIRHSPKYKWNDGWFYCTAKRMHDEIGLTTKIQTRILKLLSNGDHPIIEFRKMDIPARRHVRVDCDQIGLIIADWAVATKPGRPETVATSDPQTVATSDPETGATHTKTHFRRPTKRVGGRKTSRPSKGLITTDFDKEAAGRLREVLTIYDSDLIHPPGSVRIDTLAKNFTNLRTSGRATEAEIKSMLRWLKFNYGDVHCPDMHKASDLSKYWGKFKLAKKRLEYDHNQSDGDDDDADRQDYGRFGDRSNLISKTRDWLHENVGWEFGRRTKQEDVDRALEALGREVGELTAGEV